jgi:hypothetical protein
MPTLTHQAAGVVNWNEKPLGAPIEPIAVDPDERVFDPDSVHDVAVCLLTWDHEISVYFDLSDNAGVLAVDSARSIVDARRKLHEERMATPRVQSLARYIAKLQNREAAYRQTGEAKYTVKPSRISA